jgi:two-component system sensor kinase FixL
VGSASLDRIQIGQVIINLVRNAVEAMEASEQRELVVATRAADGAVEITVSDTGPGIASEIAARLFQPFVTTKPTGLGLGLSICREIVEAHEGQLTAAPGAAGGTVFTVRLPITPDGSDRDLPGR